jgi:hypothetical protein
MKLPITIEYNSGEQATYIAQPPEWAKMGKVNGKHNRPSPRKMGIFGI